MNRYEMMFAKLAKKNQIAFVPFTLMGDPDAETSLAVIESLIKGGADALELGIPFSDPVADGPTIQSAGVRAQSSHIRPSDCWNLIRKLRIHHPDIPIGLLVYVNLVYKPGIENFYRLAFEAGVDSVLIADVPMLEAAPFAKAAEENGILPVFIAPPNADEARLRQIAEKTRGYTYVVTRTGVTGTDQTMSNHNEIVIQQLKTFGAAPPVLGFGISKPEHVHQAKEMGADGAISGSAVVKIIEKNLDNPEQMKAELEAFVRMMKEAT